MSRKRKGLGRGLDALLGQPPAPAAEGAAQAAAEGTATVSVNSTPVELSVDQLEPNRFQPRSRFDETLLDDLAESIRAQGIVQPIVVTPGSEAGRYTIVAGERRWRASRRAGLDRVPVVVRDVSGDQQLLELALIENVQRADLDPIEEAEAYRTLAETFSLSQEEIAGRVGKGRTTITNVLRLLRLPDAVQDLLREGRLTAGQARPLLALGDEALQIQMAERAVAEKLTARQLEGIASGKEPVEAPAKKRKPVEIDVHTREAMENLTKRLHTKVEIVRKKKGGTVRIHFHDENELIRLYERLSEESGDA